MLIVDLGGLRKKYLIRCQISSSKLFLGVFIKSDYQYSQGLVQMIEGLCRSVRVLVGSTGGLIVDLGGLRKKNLIRCQISSSKVVLGRFLKK